MAFAFFRQPCDATSATAEEMNAFLRQHRIVSISKQWRESDGIWAFCIEYTEKGSGKPTTEGSITTSASETRIDYKEILPPDQFALFSRLRDLRKAISDREGQPVFAVFTNKQLAEMVQAGCRTVASLRAISGIGEARVSKYGEEVLAALSAGGTPSV